MSEPRSPADEPAEDDASRQLNLKLQSMAYTLPPPDLGRPFRKAVQALHAYPTNGEHTALTRKLLNVLVLHAQAQFASMSVAEREAIKLNRGTPKFVIAMVQLFELIGDASKHYERVYDAVEDLYQWDMRWNLMGDQGAGLEVIEHVSSRIISQWGKGVGGASVGQISYEFPHDTLMLLLEPHPYAQIDLRIVNELRTSFAIALYENCVRYLGTQHKLTARLPLHDWVSLIAGEGKYRNGFKDFNRYCLQPAIAALEAADSCPFRVRAIPVAGPNRKVVALQFQLELKQQLPLGLHLPLTWNPRTLEVLRGIYSLNDDDIKVMAATASEGEVFEALERERVMFARKTKAGQTITHRGKYLKGILRNLQAGRERDAEPEDEEMEVLPARVGEAAQKLARLRKEYEHYLTERLAEEFARQPPPEREAMQLAFEDQLEPGHPVRRWLAKGWNPPHGAVRGAFFSWLHKHHAVQLQTWLVRPEDRDFSLWMVLRHSASAA